MDTNALPDLFEPARADRFTAELFDNDNSCLNPAFVKIVDIDTQRPFTYLTLKVLQPLHVTFMGNLFRLQEEEKTLKMVLTLRDPQGLPAIRWTWEGILTVVALGNLDYASTDTI